ncbi:type II toxin-antitoxin system MqsA family antitoxin [Thermosediminibacter litoriperuensis]|uniref:YgiT-type zinc finger domain-containing protein n=1 Tax=Thermosediminibacter litoriperuensis TaxID=291989 RepID=A0A5S5AV00_9FIRM|nr:type II toxin-antitoxin system MqsA family antitoxin [Thermosediminibacter litoriperuensis]TYP56119.1 YgiT-type zinc finger domain-containing protein [Thermosediminibacter litoriperuensis]
MKELDIRMIRKLILKGKCLYCEGNLVKKRVRVDKWVNEKLIIIENVPALVCEECEEKYYDAETALRLDQYLYESNPKKIIEVPVFEYREG